MGVIKSSSDYVDIWVPGVMEKRSKNKTTKKMETKRVASDIPDDLAELVELVNSGEYSALVYDTFTKMTTRVKRYVTQQPLTDKGVNRVKITTKKGRNINHTSQQDYGVMASVVEQHIEDLWDAVMAQDGFFVLFTGHEKLLESKDVEGVTFDAYGSLATEGQQIMRALPGYLIATFRMLHSKKRGKKTQRVVVAGKIQDWEAKDRLGVIGDDDEIDVTVPRGDMSIDEHKEAIAIKTREEVWKPWFDEAESRGINGFAGVYGRAGAGKTMLVSGAVLELVERTDKPVLFADFDSEGAAALPKILVTGE